MLYCKDCNEIFSEDEVIIKDYGNVEEVWGSSVKCSYKIPVCPFCLSEDIVEAEICPKCKNHVREEDINESGYCYQCEKLKGNIKG